MNDATTHQAEQAQQPAAAKGEQSRRFVVQKAPDGKRFEVIERETLNLGGIYWGEVTAQARADYLEGMKLAERT